MAGVPKIEAAERQLNFAVYHFFCQSDPLVVHTLVGAASIVLFDLVEKKTEGSSWEAKVAADNGLTVGEFLKVARRAQNFFKHARQDHDELLVFDPQDTEELLFFAARNWGELLGANQKISMELSVFELWYLATREFSDEKQADELSEAIYEIFPSLSKLNRQQQLEKGREVLLHAVHAART